MRYPIDTNILEDSSWEFDRLVQKVSSKVGGASSRSCCSEVCSCFVRYTKKYKGKEFIRGTKKLLLHMLSKGAQGLINFIVDLEQMSCYKFRDHPYTVWGTRTMLKKSSIEHLFREDLGLWKTQLLFKKVECKRFAYCNQLR